MIELLNARRFHITNKFYNLQENRGGLIFVFVLAILLFFAYAFYCTSQGYDFAGEGFVSRVGNSWKIGCFK